MICSKIWGNRMGRKKNHETLDSKKITINLQKDDLKFLKHIGIDLEISDEEIVKFAVKSLIMTYKSIPEVKVKEDLINKETLRYHELIKKLK